MKIKALSVLIIFLFQQIIFADVGAVSTATGGTGRGAVETVDGILLNPAFVAEFPTKNFSFNYSTDEWAITVSDNGEDAYFPAALQFVNLKNDSLETQKLGFSFALPRWKKLVLGTTVSMVEYSNNPSAATEFNYRQAMADIGLTYSITRDWALGVVANKVGATEVDLVQNLQLQKNISVGLSYTYKNFARFRFDIESSSDNKTDKLIYMYGLENYINDWIIFRMGYQNNNEIAKNYMTAGFGFAGPQFGLHYAYISDTKNNVDQKHLIDLGIPF